MEFPVPGVTALTQLLQSMFGSAAAGTAAPGTPAPTVPPGGAPAQPSVPMPPVRPRNFLSEAVVGSGKGVGSGAFTGVDPLGGSVPNVSTPTEQNATTPQGQPQGRVLARLRPKDSTGDGAIKAIEMAKGKSKWGAIASGLAAGMQAQTNAESELQKLLTAAEQSNWNRYKDQRTLDRQDEQTAAYSQYYRGLANRGETARGGTGSNRVITPEERAARYGLAVQRFRQDGAQRGLTGPALDQFVDEQVTRWGIQRPELPGGPDETPPQDQQDNWSPTPGVVGRTFSRGWVAPRDASGVPAQPAQMPPPNPVPSRSPAQPGSPLDRARAAIAAGAPRDKVIERLRQNGIEPEGL